MQSLTPADSAGVYDAIRAAQPGGLGRVEEADVTDEAPPDLLTAMGLAAERDLVARQYVSDFETVFEHVVPWLEEGLAQGWSLADTIVHTHLRLMSAWPDSLIGRKCGPEVARQSAAYAAEVLAAGRPGEKEYYEALSDLDFWLRSDGHRRNPGTTADLIAAGLFVALWNGIVQPPFDMKLRLVE